jgi:hypothetical protein
MIIYINGRGMNAPELKAYISELEAENEELKQENTVVLRETDRLIKEKGQLIAENYEAKKLLRESLPILRGAIFVNYKDTNAANELYDRIIKAVGGAENDT